MRNSITHSNSVQFNKPSFIILYRIHLPEEVERCLQKFVTVPVRERGFRIHFCSSDQVLGFRSLGCYLGYPLTFINKKANYTTKTQTLFNHVKHRAIDLFTKRTIYFRVASSTVPLGVVGCQRASTLRTFWALVSTGASRIGAT